MVSKKWAWLRNFYAHFTHVCINRTPLIEILDPFLPAYVGSEEVKGFDGVVNADVQLVYLSPEPVLFQTYW